MKYAVKHLRFPEAAVETVAEFRQVAGQMLGADAMVDTPDIAFDIGDQGVDPGQDLRCLLSPSRVPATHDGDREKHPGNYSLASHQS